MANDFEEDRTDEAPHGEPFVETDELPDEADAGEAPISAPDDEPDVADVTEETEAEEPEEEESEKIITVDRDVLV